MKILHIDPDDMGNPLSGGGPIRTFEICKRLATRHEITVLTPTFPGSTPELEREGIRYIRVGRLIGNHGSSHHITFFFNLPQSVLKHKFDLLVEDFMPPFSATINPLFTRKPVVASVQWFFAEALSRRYKIPFAVGERFGIRLYRWFVVLSQSMKNLIERRHSKAHCAVIPNGVPEELFEPTPEFGDFILYLGRIDFEQKGVDLLLRALSLIPARRRLPLVLAGHTYEGDRLEALVRQLDLENWVQYIGRIGSRERLEKMATCRFVCVPSREETYGMVIAEACASGKMVVLFDRAPMSETAAPACLRARPFDTHEYAKHMEAMIETGESDLYNYSRECRLWAKQFSWDNLASCQEKFYLQAVGE